MSLSHQGAGPAHAGAPPRVTSRPGATSRSCAGADAVRKAVGGGVQAEGCPLSGSSCTQATGCPGRTAAHGHWILSPPVLTPQSRHLGDAPPSCTGPVLLHLLPVLGSRPHTQELGDGHSQAVTWEWGQPQGPRDNLPKGFSITQTQAACWSLRPVPPGEAQGCLLYTSPSPRDATLSRMPSSA